MTIRKGDASWSPKRLTDSHARTTRISDTGGSVLSAPAFAAPTPVRVLIADDHRPFCDALEAILSVDSRVEVVGFASNGLEAVDLAKRLLPDVILMDISMPQLDGVEATRLIRGEVQGTCVLMLTGSDLPADVARAREAGASGYVTKDRIAADLIDSIVQAGAR